MIASVNQITKNNVANRFLPIPENVLRGLESEPKISDFILLKELGAGSFGRVLLVQHKITQAKYAIKAIDKRNTANIQEKVDYTICKKCNLTRPKRAHHCRYCNKCIVKMDHHCFSLNKCIGENNYNYFIKYIIAVELNSGYIFWIGIYVLFNYYSEFKLFGFIKYGVLVFVSFMEWCGLFFYLLFHIYLNLADLTTLEVIYPILRVKSKK